MKNVIESFNGKLHAVKKISELHDWRKCPTEWENQKDRKYRKKPKRLLKCDEKTQHICNITPGEEKENRSEVNFKQ